MKWTVYNLKSSSTGRYYIGSTNDLARRLFQHNSGMNLSTRNRGPWVVVYKEYCESRLEARRREYQIKEYKGGNAFKKLVK